MAIQVPDEITVGESIPVRIVNSSHGGETVHVTISNGEGESEQVPVHLDAEGNGTSHWFVENWNVAKFNYGTCTEVSRHPVTVLA